MCLSHVSFRSIFARDTIRWRQLLTQRIMRWGLGIALQYRRLFYSACVGRCWRRSLRWFLFFTRTTRKYSTGRKYVLLPTQSFTAYYRHNAIFFITCKITLMQYHKRRSRAVFLPVEKVKLWGKPSARNSIHLTLKLVKGYIANHYQQLFFFMGLFWKYIGVLNQG